MRVPRAAFTLALVCLLLAPVVVADEELSLIDLVGPSLGALDGTLLRFADIVAPTPAAPLLLPAVELGRLAVDVLRALAQATVLGAADGDAGNDVGTPDEVGVVSDEQVLADGVAVPGQEVTLPGRSIAVTLPGIDQEFTTPPIGLPPQGIVVPGAHVSVDAPPVTLPAITLTTPPVHLDTPPIGTPPVVLVVPAVGVPAQEVHLDASGADVTLQELRGTIFLGPVQQPYSVGPHTIGQSLLPSAVPRTFDATTPEADVLPETKALDEPAREALPAQGADVPAQEVPLTEQQDLFPGAHVTTLDVPRRHVETPGVGVLPAQSVPVHQDPVPVTTLDVPGQHAATPEVPVTEEQVVAPALDQRADPFGDVDDIGYVGYGRDDDSSLYPYACTALVGCQRTQPLLRPWVREADRIAGALADEADGALVVPLL